MNVIDALTAHHSTLRQLYRQAEANPDMFDTFIQHLVVHHTMEEKYFYDLLEGFDEAEHDSLEAVNEHHIIEMIIKDAEGFPRDHRNFPIKIEGLGEYTLHHLDEEEQEIFPLASQLFDTRDIDTLGALFEEAKKALLGITLPELPKTLAAMAAGRAEVPDDKTSGTNTRAASVATGLGIGGLK
jgi:hemerythrin-like domain-containing protein